ncbi:hypothetical protein E6W26_28970 [Pseudomonas aeruginosa]|uniref:hypothetical protein n=1 Tax=Pseudomonas aeruginosa TaxID=287 RepID=UPI00109DFF8F|nr:hypothetical protein [Pseudomonas aeruginosa]EKV1241294.1 hypothetical protein [Pseudomonas aeruginosa]EKV8586203.1 hypothetical protein [Pseudomonas aeruginosa]ELN5407421.1 hypothetical protein [Pseudomonas aeruginosa]ELP1438612.1 hypothetical protein [Pseudomonas aeruginosa]THB16431.1 hypothetical protein E6W26_28970 [Pseudomonas aeruginosa]
MNITRMGLKIATALLLLILSAAPSLSAPVNGFVFDLDIEDITHTCYKDGKIYKEMEVNSSNNDKPIALESLLKKLGIHSFIQLWIILAALDAYLRFKATTNQKKESHG